MSYFLVVVCANESQQNIQRDILEAIDLPSDLSKLDSSKDFSFVFEQPEVLDKALAYTMLSQSSSAVKYVLDLAKDHFLDIFVTFEQIEDLVGEFPKTEEILELILNYDISMKWESEIQELNSKILGRIRKQHHQNEENKVEVAKFTEGGKTLSEELKFEIQENEDVTTLRNSLRDMGDSLKTLPPLQSEGCVYLNRECLLEALFRLRKFTTEEEFTII